MIKVLIVKENVGGSFEHQAKIKERVATELEKQLNSLEIENVYSVFPSEDENQFKLIAVVNLAPRKVKKEDK